MSSLQTMTAPAVGHRPPDPGIDIAASSRGSTSDAIVDDSDNNYHNFTRATNDNHLHERDFNTNVAAAKQNSSFSITPDLPQDMPAEVAEENSLGNGFENVDALVAGGGEGNEEKENEEQEEIESEGGDFTDINQAGSNKEKEESSDNMVKKESASEKPSDANPPLQETDKQSAATSLLAQLLGNINAQSAGPGTPENLPRTPLPEPLTDVSTPVGTNDDHSLPLMSARTDGLEALTHQNHGDIQSGAATLSNHDENTMNTEAQGQADLQLPEDLTQSETAAARFPDVVTGVMEDPLSKSSHDHSGLFAPFDADAALKNGLDLQQHDLLTNAFLSQEINMSGLPDISGYSTSFNEVAASIAGSEPRIQAFAKLEFDDGHFYVNTYSFILGRDVRAARAAFQREVQVRQVMGRPSKNKSSSGGNTSHTPNRVKRDGSAYMGSVVSDRGGIMGFDPDVPHHVSQMSRRSSVSSQPDPMLLATPAQLQTNHTDYNALAMQSLYDGNTEAKPVDMLALLPSPDACPTIPIHPPTTVDGSAAGHKGISRKHVKISYNFDKNIFEMEVMGRNGAFIGADWLAPGQLRPLHSGDYIQIGGVRVRFLLPDVPIGETGADRLEDTLMEGEGATVTGEAAEAASGDADAIDDSDLDSQDGTDQRRVTKLILKTKSTGDSANGATSPDGNDPSQPKRRGPGRPPKDGIMSKRERAEIAREQKMAAKREANGGVTPPPAKLNKPPKPRKEDSVEEVVIAQPVEKKKFVKRKQPDGSIIDVPIESIEGGEQLQPDQIVEYPKPPPPKKRKPSRSPSPDYPPESSYTQEQLAKPPYNYAVLIFDALTESRTPMTLKQIYRALKLKYPYFRFKCETEGWTSSVRHNLNGNRQLFEHAERDGKGWSWQLRAGASVEKEKKRRPSPPPPSAHISHQPPHQHYMPPPSHSYTNQSLQNQQFQFSAVPPNTFNAPPPPPPPQTNTYQRPPAPPPQPAAAAPSRNFNLPPALTPQGLSNYVSPYPCALPPDIIQLQQETQPSAPRPAIDHQRQSNSIPPPQQHHQPQIQTQQQQQQQQQHQPQPHPPPPPPPQNHQQQQPQQHNQSHQPQQPHQHHQPHQQQHSQSPFASNVSPYPPPVNNNMHHYSPQPGQGLSTAPQQPMHHHQQAYQPPHQQHPQQHSQQHPQQHPQQQQQPPPSAPAMNNNTMQEPESSMSFLERANKAIDDFEAIIMEDYDDKNYIREVLKSARARALGHAEKSSFPDGEPKDEAVLLDVLRNLIGSLKDE